MNMSGWFLVICEFLLPFPRGFVFPGGGVFTDASSGSALGFISGISAGSFACASLSSCCMHVHGIVFLEVDSPFVCCVRCVHVSVFSFLPCAIRVSPYESVIICAFGSLHCFCFCHCSRSAVCWGFWGFFRLSNVGFQVNCWFVGLMSHFMSPSDSFLYVIKMWMTCMFIYWIEYDMPV